MAPVEEVLDRQDEQWNNGQLTLVEQLLDDNVTLKSDASAVLDLICNEKRLRSAMTPVLELEFYRREYCRRFPGLASEIDHQFDCETILDTLSDTAALTVGESADSSEDDCPDAPKLPHYHKYVEHARTEISCVYRANHIALGREVAIKVNRENGTLSAATTDLIHREAKRIAKLWHPHIVDVYEVGTQDGQPYFVMPFVREGNLGGRINSFRGRYREIVQLLLPIVNAVEYAHALNVLHCDIKPANVLIDGKRWLLADFGLSAGFSNATLPPGTTVALSPLQSSFSGLGGTPGYMAPEQISGDRSNLSPRTDVFGLGALLYTLLTGRPPVSYADPTTIIPPRELNRRIPPDLEAICLKCLNASPTDRYCSAALLAEDLQRYLDGIPVAARPLTGTRIPLRFTKWVARKPWVAGFLLIATCGIAATIFQQSVNYRRLEANELTLSALTDASFDLGTMTAARGSKLGAVEPYQRALELAEDLTARNPTNSKYRFKLAVTQKNFASLLGDLGQKIERSETLLRGAVRNFEMLFDDPVLSSEAKDKAADALSNLGNQHLRAERFSEAEVEYTRAESIRRELLATAPENLERRFAVAKSDLDFGNLYREMSGKTQESIARYKAAIGELSEIAKSREQPSSLADRLQQATLNLGVTYVEQGRGAEADQLYQDAITRSEALLKSDSHNTQYRQFYAVSLANYGSRQLDAGEYDAGLKLLNLSRQQYRQVMSQQESGVSAHSAHAVCVLEISRAHYLISERPKPNDNVPQSRKSAREGSREARQLFQELAKDNPSNGEYRSYEANACTTLGNIDFVEGNLNSARVLYREALTLNEGIARPTLTSLFDRLMILNSLARVCLDQNDYPVAAESFSRGIREGNSLKEHNPSHSGLLSRLMNLYDGQGLTSHRQYNELTPADKHSEKGKEHLGAAIRSYTSALEVGEASGRKGHVLAVDAKTLHRIYYLRAMAHESNREFEKSLADWNETIKRTDKSSPDYVIFVIGRASSTVKKGDHVGAVAILAAKGNEIHKIPNSSHNAACVYAQAYRVVEVDKSQAAAIREQLKQKYVLAAVEILSKARDRGDFSDAKGRQQLIEEEDLDPIRNRKEYMGFLETLPKK